MTVRLREAGLDDRDDGWSIAEFWVTPERRRDGVGRSAMDVLAAHAQSDGAAYLEAKVHPDNREALPFWLAVGFSEVEAPCTRATVTRRSLLRQAPSAGSR